MAPVSQPFLACYDYGQGGVWLLLDAPSLEDAQRAYPELTVFASRPAWMSEVQEAEYRASCERAAYRWHINQPAGWLEQHFPRAAGG
jgi:hypothetical protein